MAFRTSIIGYDKKQVNEHIAKSRASDSEALQRQKKRIMSLRDENEKLTMELNGYKHKERAIVSAMVDSRRIAESIVINGKNQAISEMQSLLNDINFANSTGGISPYQLKMAIEDTCKKIHSQIDEIKRTSSI